MQWRHVEVIGEWAWNLKASHNDAVGGQVVLFSGEVKPWGIWTDIMSYWAYRNDAGKHKTMSACGSLFAFQKPRQIANHINKSVFG